MGSYWQTRDFGFIVFLALCTVIFLSIPSEASWGDRSKYYVKCMNSCVALNCSSEDLLVRFHSQQSLAEKLTRWNCSDECDYFCMWHTVDYFIQNVNHTPQFHGKWPFVRVYGMQEPASVAFSLLNLVSFSYMLMRLTSEVPSSAPMYNMWMAHCAVGIVTWICSTIFHMRDKPLTEKLDYFCAFAGVLYSFYCCVFRILSHRYPLHTQVFGAICAVYFGAHVSYLSLVKFDYGYNMTVTVTIGLLNSVSWLYWAYVQWQSYPPPSPASDHLKYCVSVVLLVAIFLSLELADFPPIAWTFDAHSLWHLGTAPLPVLWSEFIVRDCNLLHKYPNADYPRKKLA